MLAKLCQKTLERALEETDVSFGTKNEWDIEVLDERLFLDVILRGSLGFGEGYMRGWWTTKRIDKLFTRLSNAEMHKKVVSPLDYLLRLRKKLKNQYTRKRSKKVAEVRYNLGNDFFRDKLGETMFYTCAFFDDLEKTDTDNMDLEEYESFIDKLVSDPRKLGQAQYLKMKRICNKLAFKEGQRILELGCGWGTLAIHMAKEYGVSVVAYNNSEEQVKFAKQKAEEKGLSEEQVQFREQDYRDAYTDWDPETFDSIIDVGNFEHKGLANYRNAMAGANKLLKPNGVYFIHTIAKYASNNITNAWIDKYIFPGGKLPSAAQIFSASEPYFRCPEHLENMGAHYDPTLMSWHNNNQRNWEKHKEHCGKQFERIWGDRLGTNHDKLFERMERLYNLQCAGGFRSRSIHLYQIPFSKKGRLGGFKRAYGLSSSPYTSA